MYPITDEKRAELRSKGILPFSRDFISAGSIVGLAVTFLIIGKSLFGKLRDAFAAGASPANDSIELTLKQSFSLYSELAVSLVGGVLFFVIAFGLLQSKFLFNFALVFGGFDRRRPISGNNCDLSRRVRNGFLGGVKYALLCLMILLYGSVIFDAVQIEAFSSLRSMSISSVDRIANVEVFTAALTRSFYWIFFLTVFFMSFVAICSLVLNRLQFAFDHQMSREEVEIQARESNSTRVVEYEPQS